MRNARCILIALAAALVLGQASLVLAQAEKPDEAKLLSVLKSGASQEEKAAACRQLVTVGTKQAVPVLAGLLGDEQMSHMARYALEPIPDPAVEEALREALGKVQGRLLVGVISSISVRRDAKALDALAKLLGDADPLVAGAAAMALGTIGGEAAAKALDGALSNAPASVRWSVCDGYLRIADGLMKENKGQQAAAVYDRLRQAEVPGHVKIAATGGAIVARGAEGLPLLLEALKSDAPGMFAVAQRVALELPGTPVTQALAAELGALPAAKQVLLTQDLAIRGDKAALPAVVALAKGGEAQVRLTAIRVLPQFKDTSVTGLLFDLASEESGPVASTAQTALVGLAGKEVDEAMLGKLQSADTKVRRVAVEILAQRRVKAIVPSLMKAAEDPDGQIRSTSIKALGELAGMQELPGLIGLLVRAKESQDLQAAEGALASTCVRLGNEDACAAQIIAAMGTAQPGAKSALIRVLRSVGGSKSLQAVRSARSDASPEVQEAAVRELCKWTSLEVAPDLLDLAKNATKPNHKVLALNGYVRLSRERSLSADKRLGMCQEAMALAQRDEEKRVVLGALGSIQNVQALNLVLPYLDQPGVRDEAAAAVLSISEKLVQRQPAAVAKAAQKVLEVVKEGSQADRAKALLKQAQGAQR